MARTVHNGVSKLNATQHIKHTANALSQHRGKNISTNLSCPAKGNSFCSKAS